MLKIESDLTIQYATKTDALRIDIILHTPAHTGCHDLPVSSLLSLLPCLGYSDVAACTSSWNKQCSNSRDFKYILYVWEIMNEQTSGIKYFVRDISKLIQLFKSNSFSLYKAPPLLV